MAIDTESDKALFLMLLYWDYYFFKWKKYHTRLYGKCDIWAAYQTYVKSWHKGKKESSSEEGKTMSLTAFAISLLNLFLFSWRFWFDSDRRSGLNTPQHLVLEEKKI